eukprot:TRINITY_DN931_c0_g1_i3.p1 TRINITY_DN931_c0_g1~~TRINITY_DN931_c0_g1_i3.p1  ORF type:complete len:1231 (+),score=313.08 TRINITY_DN931_c0_g1_i3:395-3694(+)
MGQQQSATLLYGGQRSSSTSAVESPTFARHGGKKHSGGHSSSKRAASAAAADPPPVPAVWLINIPPPPLPPPDAAQPPPQPPPSATASRSPKSPTESLGTRGSRSRSNSGERLSPSPRSRSRSPSPSPSLSPHSAGSTSPSPSLPPSPLQPVPGSHVPLMSLNVPPPGFMRTGSSSSVKLSPASTSSSSSASSPNTSRATTPDQSLIYYNTSDALQLPAAASPVAVEAASLAGACCALSSKPPSSHRPRSNSGHSRKSVAAPSVGALDESRRHTYVAGGITGAALDSGSTVKRPPSVCSTSPPPPPVDADAIAVYVPKHGSRAGAAVAVPPTGMAPSLASCHKPASSSAIGRKKKDLPEGEEPVPGCFFPRISGAGHVTTQLTDNRSTVFATAYHTAGSGGAPRLSRSFDTPSSPKPSYNEEEEQQQYSRSYTPPTPIAMLAAGGGTLSNSSSCSTNVGSPVPAVPPPQPPPRMPAAKSTGDATATTFSKRQKSQEAVSGRRHSRKRVERHSCAIPSTAAPPAACTVQPPQCSLMAPACPGGSTSAPTLTPSPQVSPCASPATLPAASNSTPVFCTQMQPPSPQQPPMYATPPTSAYTLGTNAVYNLLRPASASAPALQVAVPSRPTTPSKTAGTKNKFQSPSVVITLMQPESEMEVPVDSTTSSGTPSRDVSEEDIRNKQEQQYFDQKLSRLSSVMEGMEQKIHDQELTIQHLQNRLSADVTPSSSGLQPNYATASPRYHSWGSEAGDDAAAGVRKSKSIFGKMKERLSSIWSKKSKSKENIAGDTLKSPTLAGGSGDKEVPAISQPQTVTHGVCAQHGTNNGLVGMPNEWKQQLLNNGISEDEIEKHPEDIIKVLEFKPPGEEQGKRQEQRATEQQQQQQQFSAAPITDEQANIQAVVTTTAEVMNQYGKLTHISGGAVGEIYVTVHKTTKKKVAVKVMKISDKNAKQVATEISVLKSSQHPNMVRFYDCFYKPADAQVWALLEFMDAGSLAGLIDDRRTGLVESHIAYICQCVLNALYYMHSHRRLHRDIKSDNVLLNSAGEVKICDFGYVAQLKTNDDRVHSVVGSAHPLAFHFSFTLTFTPSIPPQPLTGWPRS